MDAIKNQYLLINFIEFQKKRSDFNNGCAKWALIGETRNQILTNILRKAFMHADTESVKFQLSCQYLFALLGSVWVKAARDMLVKLTKGIKINKQISHFLE